ncbi:conjugal transfer protein TraI [Verminephrobacter aporrectodeae subsp. tuberculatae]|uniref:Conjugal transfer protein TraI n=1 Tax=Verminephrobacter aporrectodeae subsp. tuberculatae TaxID=1110392 RepID=A0ABT3KZB1_9BURK|nr:TraB/VirB10 family protein [Verminephrobacter aporrectodeae]MCW5323678.1 conjugal transfer protein TraI [Verminephrobacter aporrectodeae subsp. tuberculatae]
MSDPNTQTKKRQMMLIGGAVTGILGLIGAGMFLFDSEPAQNREKPRTVSITAPGTVDDRDAWRAQQAAKEKSNESLIGEVKTQLRAQEEQNKRLGQALEELKANKATSGSAGVATAARPDGSVLDKPLPIGTGPGQRVLQSPSGNGGATALNPPLNQDVPARREVEIITFNNTEGKGAPGVANGGAGGITEVLGFPTDEKAKKYGTTSDGADGKKQTIEFLPAGSFVRVAMLNGVDAPTGGQAQSNPLPVAFHVLDVANLANKHRLDIKDCRIVAATWGDLSSERMMGRTETLACVINGEAIEMAIKGQVIGEDGKAGVRGRLVTKQGQLLANALFAGALSGIGKAFQSSANITSTSGGGITQTIDPDKIGQAALGGGVGSAGQQLAQYYLKAADKLYPVIETDGGRAVEILITKGAVYSGKALAKDDYRGLLKRTGTNSRRYEDD